MMKLHNGLLLVGLFLSAGAASAADCPPAYTFTGEVVGDQLGTSVSGAGDVNNDGFDDIIVGAVLNNAGGTNAGRAYVYSGLTGDTLYTFTGEAADDQFGGSVSGAGDVNNDGFDDLIVGAHQNDAGGFRAGRAYVYSGQSGALLYTFTGEAAGDGFGRSVSGAGDVNNDGNADLIVGAYTNDARGTDAGRAYVYSGLTGDTLYTFTGEAAGDYFGIAVSGAGDVNHDGNADLIVGGSWNDAGGGDAGRAYVYSGINGDTLYTFTGEAAANLFGQLVSGAGDVNNDGFDDLIIGAFWNSGGGRHAGRAYVFSGLDGDTLYTFTGEAEEDQFGISVSGAGDVNNDGFDDLIVGARWNNAGGPDAGRAYVYSGQSGVLLRTFTGEAAEDYFGYSVSGAGDVNNDGSGDLIVGGPWNDAGGDKAGRAYVYTCLEVGIIEVFEGLIPESFYLSSNYPNPFNPITTIRFSLPSRTHVSLTVYNLLGQKVATLVDRERHAGVHEVVWKGMDSRGNQVASGVYLYKMKAGKFTETRTMVLLK